MLTNEKLAELALDLESDRVERKEALTSSTRGKIAQAMCAFANDLPSNRSPGVVLVGLKDDGSPAGTSITDDLLLNLSGIRGSSLEDLDLEFFRGGYLPSAVSPEVLAENGRPLEQQLRALRLLTPTGEVTAGAVLLLGKDPQVWVPGAYIQFVRFAGADITSAIVDQKELTGRLDAQLRQAEEVATLNIRIATRVEGGVVEQRQPDYPIAALQQLLRNAVMHRSYEINSPIHWYWFDDRVEIHSPGGLYGRVSPENFGASFGATDYRNPIVAEGLKVTGYVQRFGMGIPLSRRRCQENGNPAPDFQFQPGAVLAVVERAP